MNRPFFTMSNVHVASCGEPPALSNDNPDYYHGYFENRHGEQWIFTYCRSKRKAEIRGGDADWASVYEVVDGKVEELVLSTDERLWLAACWAAVTEK
jgi:hypothetical protein